MVGQKSGWRSNCRTDLEDPLEGTFFILSSFNFVRMISFIKSRSYSELGHVASKPRSLVQMIENPFVHSRGHNLDPKFIKLCQNVNPLNV